MAGGFGSRMKDLTKNTPKPMLTLQGKPILEYTIEMCKRYGITDIAISVYYLGDQIKTYFGDGSRFGVNITYFEEPEPLGTAGVLRLYKEWLNEPFVMCNADELKDVDLHAMYKAHCETGALATDALTKVDDPSQYGVVALTGNRIDRFVEKPKREEAPSNLINAGLYIINPEVVSMVPEGFVMIEKAIFPVLAEQGKLYGFQFGGQWFDTGTPERYAFAEAHWGGFSEGQAVQVPA
jgi:NDP-sugar pyrophosphorylase family protein